MQLLYINDLVAAITNGQNNMIVRDNRIIETSHNYGKRKTKENDINYVIFHSRPRVTVVINDLYFFSFPKDKNWSGK